MLKYPPSTASQQSEIGSLLTLASRYPVCELWILLERDVAAAWNSLSPEGLRAVSRVAKNVSKVFRRIQSTSGGSLLALSYISKLANSSHSTHVLAAYASLSASGSTPVSLTSDAVSALDALDPWDDVQGLYVPANPGDLGRRLVMGVVIGS